MDILELWADASKTSLGFFWKAGWAFVLGYAISGMIQAFVPKARLTRRMGDPGAASVSLATVFGAASSSCSFAALAAPRSLVLKGRTSSRRSPSCSRRPTWSSSSAC